MLSRSYSIQFRNRNNFLQIGKWIYKRHSKVQRFHSMFGSDTFYFSPLLQCEPSDTHNTGTVKMARKRELMVRRWQLALFWYTHLLLITQECIGFWADRADSVNKSIKKSHTQKNPITIRGRNSGLPAVITYSIVLQIVKWLWILFTILWLPFLVNRKLSEERLFAKPVRKKENMAECLTKSTHDNGSLHCSYDTDEEDDYDEFCDHFTFSVSMKWNCGRTFSFIW